MSQSNCTNYGCDEVLGTYNENECGLEIPGGGDAALLLECNHTITDPSNEAQIAANVAAGLAHRVTGVSITIEKATPNILNTNVPCKPNSVIGYSRTGTYYNPNVSGPNVTFHNTLMGGKKFGGAIVHLCGADNAGIPSVLWIDAQIVISGSLILPGSNKEAMRFEGDWSWEDIDNPMMYEMPTNFFG